MSECKWQRCLQSYESALREAAVHTTEDSSMALLRFTNGSLQHDGTVV